MAGRSQPQLGWGKSSVESPYGTIRSEWKNEGQTFDWTVEIPPNTIATLHIPCRPGKEPSEGEHRNLQKKLTPVKEGRRVWLMCEIDSRTYHFSVE